MSSIYRQLRQRRKALGLRQKDMLLKVGMTRQQYQRLETGGNPRVQTLELVAKGLNMELMLVPQAKIRAIRKILEQKEDTATSNRKDSKQGSLVDDPWQDMLED
jgi:transcriptional regulator with XRE-family HTH domain